LPRITIRFRPTHDYGHHFTHQSVGSNHIRYIHEGSVIRLTSDAPLSYIESEAPFVVTRPLHLVFANSGARPASIFTRSLVVIGIR